VPVLRTVTFEQVSIAPGARAALFAHVSAEPERETGGILIGYVAGTTLHVTGVSPPGPKAVKRRNYFSRDTKFLQGWLERRYARSGHDYIGEWHVHHALGVPPSGLDKRSLWSIARKSNYPTTKPLLIIVEDTPRRRLIRCYRFRVRPKKTYDELELIGS
jgi:integrative and conjugative element protein (TIGR02256 family)